DDRQRVARNLDPWAREAAFADGIADRDHRARVPSEIAHGGEAGAGHLERVGEAEGGAVGVGIFLREAEVPWRAGGLGQMDVDVGHAGHHGARAFVDDDRARWSGESAVDSRYPAVLDDHGRIAALRLSGVDDQMPRLDREA